MGTVRRKKPATSARKLLRRHSARSDGLREIRLLVPDTARTGFKADVRRQSQRIAQSSSEAETMSWVDRARDTRGWNYDAET